MTEIRTTDVGSFPLTNINLKVYFQGAAELETGLFSDAANYFIQNHNRIFLKKISSLGPNLSVPCYVQGSHTRDMLSQFLDPIVRQGQGLQRRNDAYHWDGTEIQVPARYAQIGELLALRRGAEWICHELDIPNIEYRACITGPFEMLTRLWRGMGIRPHYNESLIEAFSKIVQAYTKNAVIKTKYLIPSVITLDEPSIGVSGVGDFFIDAPSDPNLSHLISSWNPIFESIPHHLFRGLHLHASPYHQLANAQWNLLEAHFGVVVSKSWLIENDKYIRAAILRTDGPTIPPHVDLQTAWTEIQSNNYFPYLQSKSDMMVNLKTTVERYGLDRIPFAGPECGFGSWDWKFGESMVLDSMTRLREVVTEFNQISR